MGEQGLRTPATAGDECLLEPNACARRKGLQPLNLHPPPPNKISIPMPSREGGLNPRSNVFVLFAHEHSLTTVLPHRSTPGAH